MFEVLQLLLTVFFGNEIGDFFLLGGIGSCEQNTTALWLSERGILCVEIVLCDFFVECLGTDVS